MSTHIIAYEGIFVSLGIMQRQYESEVVRFVNRHEHVQGTRMRPPYVPKDFNTFIDRIEAEKGKNEVFAILLHSDIGETRAYRYIGHTGVHNIRYPEANGVTGSVIGDPGTQGKGYGKEAKLLLQSHAFNALHLHKLKSEVKAWNAQSLGHLIACGYRICGRMRDEDVHHGKRIDAIQLECFREDWEPIWNVYRASGKLPGLSEEQREIVRKETNQQQQ